MKIKVKLSGEVYYADYWENRDVRIDEEEIKGTIDWAAFRREAAKDILCALIIHCSLAREDGARIAIEYADELIKQLKEEKA